MKITIEVDDHHKLETLMAWLRENKFLDEITVKAKKPDYPTSITKGDKSIDPTALFGMWKDNPRTLEEIRKDAWGIGYDSLHSTFGEATFDVGRRL